MKISSTGTCSSSSRRRRKKNSLVLLLLLCLVSTIQVATGCGAIFSRTSKDDDEMVIRQAAVVFAMDHTTSVHMHIQLFYEGASAKDDEFAWILPIPASDNTRVSLGTDVLFHSLAQATRPRFELEMEMNSKSCGSSSSSLEQQEAQQPYACPFPKDAMSGNTPSSSAADDTDSHTSGEEQAEEFSTLSEFAILQAPNSNGNSSSTTASSSSGKNTNILEWLAQNNYRTPPKTHSFIHYYAQQGHQFVALRFQPTSTTRGEIQPIVVTFEKTPQEQSDQFAARLPMQWASLAGTNDNNYDIQVHFLANARVTPVNYLDVTLDDALHDWVGCYNDPSCHEDNYRQRFSQATGATDNQTQTMITEYAGNSSILDVAIPLTAIDLYEAENPLEFLQMLAHANVPSTPHVLSIIHQFLPPIFSYAAPPFCQQLTTVYQDQGNSSSSTIIPVAPCLANYHPTDWRWDPIELAIQLEEHVFIPSKDAQATLQDYPYLTSLYTRISSSREAMNDAFFAFTTTTPTEDSSVSPIHRATASPQCRKSDGTPVALKISTHDDTRTSTATVPATVGCHGWFPTIPQPLDPQVATATEVTAWGVPRTGAWVVARSRHGTFDPDDVQAAVDFANGLIPNQTVSDYTYPVVEDVVILGNRTTTTTTITTTNSTTGQQDVVILGNGTTATLTTTTTSSTVILAAPLLLEPEQLQDEYPPQPMHQTSVIYREPPPESVIANSTEQEDDYRGQQVEQPPTTIPPRTSSPSTEQLVTLVDGKDVIGSTWPFSYASTEVSGAIKAECLCEVLVLGLTLAPLLWFF